MRRAAFALLAALFAQPAGAEITGAAYADPTTRYGHGVLGDAVEWGALELTLPGRKLRFVLPQTRVFEDIAPRLADLDGDGAPEVIVVETDLAKGAQLAIYDETGKRAATPFIGRSNRWLAPIGAADLDGDGRVEVGYIDRPHLAKTLRLWRLEGGKMVHLADLEGLTNHRIGQDFISGGVRDCGAGPELVVASADWARVMAVRFTGAALQARDLGPHDGPGAFDAALACKGS